MSPRFTLSKFEFFSHQTRTRFPFRYGIASMTEVPHLFLRAHVKCNGKTSLGLASEGLPPKWFTKNPASAFAEDLAEMCRVIEHAAALSEETGGQPLCFFDYWRELVGQQSEWARAAGVPPLLANLGVSVCERAVLDALCRGFEMPLHELIRKNHLGLRLGEIYPELAGLDPTDLLPAQPLRTAYVRHTVGLTDPLTPAGITDTERVDDGLPQDLQGSIRAYGLRYFKIKLSGRAAHDTERLSALRALLRRETDGEWFATVDGNEAFSDFHAFRLYWDELSRMPHWSDFRKRLLAVEQPLHRDPALSDAAGEGLRDWPGHPPLIIDESDGAVGDVPRALALGYAGASHKNCKGIVKGLANACLLAQRRRQGQPGLLTGEDLCNLGPVALLQDLAMMALLGIEHIERNGHHYYRGLSMWPQPWEETVLAAHPDLYTRHPQGFARLQITDGQVALESVNASPFGLRPLFDPATLDNSSSLRPA
jgi:hypothetical protein